ncbi:hypothetical protein CDD82_1755 [Ophiocordyceps australis]|uniref:Chitin synthase activator n=1 Tax=Ophiocordyceps australis TaxID=1399860 RepID=A0A2C5YAS4_9HYPO|nr:hypothetical protein CDD82_1755 [Ophiocordyceps australis]
MANLGATFVPGGADDYFLPQVVSPAPQRITPQVPQNMQDDLQRLELNDSHDAHRMAHYVSSQQATTTDETDIRAYRDIDNSSRSGVLDGMDWNAPSSSPSFSPSFSPFPKITGDNVPPSDDAKEEILWNARKHVLNSQKVTMQISWARDVLIWAEIAMDAAAREPASKARSATPRIEHELRIDALNIITYLAQQDHPDALYIQSKWLEFGKFGHRVDKREAFNGYRRAAELGNARSEYRMGMLFEQSNDMPRAKEHYSRGMALDDSAALYRMGMMSLLGQHGEARDYPRGLERIQAAAEGADEDAPQGSYVYGMLLGRELPDITIPDRLLPMKLDSAKMYVEKAAYLGFAKAQLKMGQAYELCQLSCEFYPSYSLHYYGLAAKQGLPEAALGVSRWFLFGYEGVFKKNEELAFRYAHEAAVAKLATGEFAMGYYHEIGIHVPKQIDEARRWYRLAADHGNKDALGRLESLDQHRSLSKADHETTTLTRIKSQHGSQKGKRPERLKQLSQQMPTLSEGSMPSTPVDLGPRPGVKSPATVASPRISPLPSPGLRPTIVSEPTAFPDPSRASVVASDRQNSAFSIRSGNGRGRATGPLPDNQAYHATSSQPLAPYPEDDVHGEWQSSSGLLGSSAFGVQAERPLSALGNKQQTAGPRPMPSSNSTGSLQLASQAPPRDRHASAGYESHNVGSYGQASLASGGRSYMGGDEAQTRPVASLPYPTNNRLQKQQSPYSSMGGLDATREYGPSRPWSRPGSEIGGQPDGHGPGAAGIRSERLSSLPAPDLARPPRTASGMAAPSMPMSPRLGPGGRTGSAPPGQTGHGVPSPAAQSSASVAAKPSKGPATFEDMGIPQGKKESDCVLM